VPADAVGARGGGQRAKLLDARERDRKYLLEYTVQKPEEDEPRHFLSAVSLGFNGRRGPGFPCLCCTAKACLSICLCCAADALLAA